MKRNRWMLHAAVFVSMLLLPTCWAFGLGGLFGSGDDSGNGKVAKFEFRVKDGFAATSIAWSPDGKYIATSGTHTNLIHIWDVAQRALVRELKLPYEPSARYHNLAWSPDGRYLVTCDGFDAQLLIYGTGDWKVAKQFGLDQARACQKAVFSSDGSELTMWGDDLVTFATSDWRELRRIPSSIFDDQLPGNKLHMGWAHLIGDIAYIGNSKTLVIGGGQYERRVIEPCGETAPEFTDRIWIIEPTDKALTRSFVVRCSPLPGGGVRNVVPNPSGTQFALSAIERGKYGVHVVDSAVGKLLSVPLKDYPQDRPYGISYMPDGRFLLIGVSHDYRDPSPIYVLDAKSYKVLDAVHAAASIHDMTVEPGSSRFAVSSSDGFAVWALSAVTGTVTHSTEPKF